MHNMTCADISALYTTKGIKVGHENSHRKQTINCGLRFKFLEPT